jgi:hypothetical protein
MLSLGGVTEGVLEEIHRAKLLSRRRFEGAPYASPSPDGNAREESPGEILAGIIAHYFPDQGGQKVEAESRVRLIDDRLAQFLRRLGKVAEKNVSLTIKGTYVKRFCQQFLAKLFPLYDSLSVAR